VKHKSIHALALTGLTFVSALCDGGIAASADGVETIILIRHGEKPHDGLGQLNCQGLNRALALPAVIAKKYGGPGAVFAPDPAQQKEDDGVLYDYVRPLATVEPAAIYFGLPINAAFGVTETDKLAAALRQPGYDNMIVLVAWEHKLIETIARQLLAANGGDAGLVPHWDKDDYDSIYVIKISGAGKAAQAHFTKEQEGLDRQPDACPQAQ
jgi:hypothetical protein